MTESEFLAEARAIVAKSPMLVFYGFAKLTAKIMRKPAILILFENSRDWNLKKEAALNQKMHIVYVREQSPAEAQQGQFSNREWTRYEYYVFHNKRYAGSLDRVLEENYLSETKHVSDFEKYVIRERLREQFYQFYNKRYLEKLKIALPKAVQQQLIFT